MLKKEDKNCGGVVGGKKHTNKQGVIFDIDITKISVHEDEDYFSYYLNIIAVNDKARPLMYKAILTKELCPTIIHADFWIKTTVLNFLKNEILETYNNGRCLNVSSPSKQWSII